MIDDDLVKQHILGYLFYEYWNLSVGEENSCKGEEVAYVMGGTVVRERKSPT